MQAVPVSITINNKTYTVASVYVPPSEAINELAFDRMINSFSSHFLILGDFNGHSHLWGAYQENEREKVVEKLIDRHNLILLNDSVHTRFDTYHQTSSLLDLSLLFDIAGDNIPKTSPFPKRKAKPWFDEDCQAAKRKEIELVYQLINILVLSIQCEHS